MIISSVACAVIMVDGFFIMHTPQEYHGYTQPYFDAIAAKVGVVSVSFVASADG